MNNASQLSSACLTPACWNMSSYVQETMSPHYRVLNRCNDLPEWACGGFTNAHKDNMPPHRHRLDPMTVMQDGVDEVLRGFLDRPYAEVYKSLADAQLQIDGFVRVDAENLAKAASYHRTCMASNTEDSATALVELMREVRRPFAALDRLISTKKDGKATTYKPAVNTGRRMASEDWHMLSGAQVNLAQLGIFPFFKIEVQQSFVDPNKTAIVLIPEYRGATPDGDSFRIKLFRDQYYAVMTEFLKMAYAENLPRIQNLKKVTKAVVRLERDIVQIQLWKHWRHMKFVKEHVEEVGLNDLEHLAPELRLKDTVWSIAQRYNATVEGVEVIRPMQFRRVNNRMKRHTRETIRAYIMWQAFLQTVDLWDVGWTKNGDVRTPTDTFLKLHNLTREERCISRVQRHFGHILDSFFIRKEYSPAIASGVKEMTENIRREWRNMALNTEWLSDKGRSFIVEKLDRLDISFGHPLTPHPLKPKSIADFYAGAEVRAREPSHKKVNGTTSPSSSLRLPDRWTHFHDYFHLQLWHGNRSWSRLDRAPWGADEWPSAAHSLRVQYMPLKNQLIIPAGLMRQPLYHTELPSYRQYGALGTLIGTGMAKVIDGEGQQYQVNGSARGETWTSRDWRRYSRKLRCFNERWRRKWGIAGHFFPLNLESMYETIVGDHEGMEAAYRAWVPVKRNSTDMPLPLLEVFSSHEMYWMARATRFCVVRRAKEDTSFKAEAMWSDTPPHEIRLMEPVLDFGPFHISMNCRCGSCLYKKCRIFGKFLKPWGWGALD